MRDWGDVFQRAALEPGQWLWALGELADACGASRGQLIGFGSDSAVSFNWAYDVDARIDARMAEIDGYHPSVNFRLAARLPGPTAKPILAEADYAAVIPTLAGDTYLDFCREVQISWGCQTDVISGDNGMVGLALLRSDADGVTQGAQLAEFARAVPGVRAAVRMQHAIESRGLELVTNMLDTMSVSCVMLDAAGRVGAVTAGADRLFAQGGQLIMEERRLASPIAACRRAIDGAVQQVLAGSIHARLPLADGRRLDLFRLPAREWNLSFTPRVLAVIRDLHEERDGGAMSLRLAYGLTAAEADVTSLLARGWDRARIAAHRGTSIGTLRNQIKTIYAKVDVRREAELVALVAAWHG